MAPPDRCRTARRGDVPSHEPDVLVLASPARSRVAAQVAASLADLGRVRRGDLATLSTLSWSPPNLTVLVGDPDELPGLVGSLGALRAEADARALPVLALGLASSEEEIVRLLAAGANESLGLPPRTGELRAKARRLLTRDEAPEGLGRGARISGRYQVKGALGSGAYGSVYEAWDDLAGRTVALKVIPASGPQARERFLREAYTLASVRDPHIAAVRDVFEEEGRLVLASDLIRGPTLRRAVLDAGGLAAGDVARLLRGLAGALGALSRAGLVHRDVKPANVILRGGEVGTPVLVDFGLAKGGFDRAISSAEFVMGTPGYMAPEVLDGAIPDPRADLFALGMVGRFCLTGDEYRPDLCGSDLVRAMIDDRVDMPATPELPGLQDVLLALTEPDPELRLGSVRALVTTLDAIMVPEAA